MATPLEQLIEDMASASRGASGLQSEIFKLEQNYASILKTQREESKTLKGAIAHYASHRKIRKEEIKLIVEKNKALQREQKDIEKLRKIVEAVE